MFFNVMPILILIMFSVNIYGQSFKSRYDLNTPNKIYMGFTQSLSYTDIPMLAAYLMRNDLYYSGVRNSLRVGPSYIDKSIAANYGSDKNTTFGSMDKDIIPNYVFYGRMGLLAAADMFFDTDVSPKAFRQVFLYEKALLYTYTITEVVKNSIKRTRPDGSDSRSFFSGHTSTAFASSTYLFLELNDFYDKWDVTRNNKTLRTTFKATTFSALYGWAAYVGYSRINDKKHYLSDVLTGAAVGTAVSYFIYTAYNKSFDAVNLSLNSHTNSVYFSYRVGL